MFPDLSQSKALLHLSIPSGQSRRAWLCYSCIYRGWEYAKLSHADYASDWYFSLCYSLLLLVNTSFHFVVEINSFYNIILIFLKINWFINNVLLYTFFHKFVRGCVPPSSSLLPLSVQRGRQWFNLLHWWWLLPLVKLPLNLLFQIVANLKRTIISYAQRDKNKPENWDVQLDLKSQATLPSELSWKLSTREARVHFAATRRAAFLRRS